MPTTKKTTKKSADKCAIKCSNKCKCEKCNCEHSQVAFYVLIAILAAISTILIVSLSFNKSVSDIFRPSTYVYNGNFEKEKSSNLLDENGFIQLSAGAVIDMMNTGKDGILLIGEGNCITCDAFARRVHKYGTSNIYRYSFDVESDDVDDNRAKSRIQGCDDTPVLVYIKNGAVYDRLDDVKDESLLASFMAKYNAE